jgi:epsilon-lactone hydrolase
MASIRSRLFIFALKNRYLFTGKGPSNTDWTTSIPQLRAQTDRGSGLMGKLPAGFSISPLQIGSLPAEWIRPPQSPHDRAILYFHGGGYVIGSMVGHRPIVSKFVQASGVPALVFNYRLAPEHPFPAALEDALAAYRCLLDQGIAPHKIVFAGDSAGGGLVLAALVALRDQGLPLPAGAVALSPWTDLKCTGESLKTNIPVDTLTWRDSWLVFSQHYTAGQDAGQPWISPLYADLGGLPPLLIFAGGDELLRDDSTRFAEKARAAGVEVTLHVGQGMFHCYPACAPIFPEATQAMQEIGEFVSSRIH